jgi:aspartate kinase
LNKEIVCKFGGSSVENAEQIKKVYDIMQENRFRKYLVLSAPGKDEKYHIKITDHLLNIAKDGKHLNRKELTKQKSIEVVLKKFSTLLNDLGLEKEDLLQELEKDLKDVRSNMEQKIAFLASRGEHYNAKVVSMFFSKNGIKNFLALPEEIGFLTSESHINAKIEAKTYENLKALQDKDELVIMPGFYGINEKNEIMILSRGGSDLTGGELAFSVQARLYENWSDVDGVYEVDPRIISKADVIPRLTFKEIRLLSSKGFNVFHFDAMTNCKKANIPINIRNTNKPSTSGTMILKERVPEEEIAGIAKLDNMASIYIEKDGLGKAIGSTEKLLGIFNKYKIKTYYYPTDKDDIAILLKKDDLSGQINNLRRDIQEAINPEKLEVVYDISILSLVGIGMKYNSTAIADAVWTLKKNHIDLEMIDQGPSKISFHIGVAQQHADKALELLHENLILKQNV